MTDRRTVHRLVMDLIKGEFDQASRVLMFKYCWNDRRFIDRVIQHYIQRCEARNFAVHAHLHQAFWLITLKPSRATQEQLLKAFLRIGAHAHVGILADGLKRTLTADELNALCGKYVKGGVKSGDMEQELMKLAYKHGGQPMRETFTRAIADMHTEWANSLD